MTHIKKIDENYKLNPISPYAVSKLSAELYTPLFMNTFCILRYSNVYGPRQTVVGEGAVIPTFIKRMKRNAQVNIHGDGNQVRDFIFVGDVAEVNLKALESRRKLVVNVSTGKATSINDLFKALCELTGYSRKPVYTDERPGDVRRVVLDNSRMLKEFNYLPKTSLKKGLRLTLDYFSG